MVTEMTGSATTEEHPVRLTVWLRGRVQGVGMRWAIRSRALELGLDGWAANRSDGRVEVVAEGPREQLGCLLNALRARHGLPGHITAVVERWSDASGVAEGFLEK